MSNKYILFTWVGCSQCKDLKQYVNTCRYRNNIYHYDVSEIPRDGMLMDLYKRVAPNGEVPVMITYHNNIPKSVHIGMRDIRTII